MARRSNNVTRTTGSSGRLENTSKLQTSKSNSTLQNIIARTTASTGNSNNFSGQGIEQTMSPLYVYNLEKGLSHEDLVNRYQTMTGRTLSKSEARNLHAVRVKSQDYTARQSWQDAFGKEIRTVRIMEAWRLSFS